MLVLKVVPFVQEHALNAVQKAYFTIDRALLCAIVLDDGDIDSIITARGWALNNGTITVRKK